MGHQHRDVRTLSGGVFRRTDFRALVARDTGKAQVLSDIADLDRPHLFDLHIEGFKQRRGIGILFDDRQLRISLDLGIDGITRRTLDLDPVAIGILALEAVGKHHMRDALAGLHLTGVVERDVQLAHDLAVLPGGGDTDRLAANTFDHGRIRTGSVQPQIVKITKKRVRVAADDDIGTIDHCGKLQLVPVTIMGEKDDVIDPRCLQLIHHLLCGFGLVQKDGRLVWARGQLRLADDINPDDADPHPVHLHDGIRLDIVRRAGRGQGGDADLGLDVGGQHRRAAVTRIQEIEEFCQSGITLVEFMVAQRERIETDLVHQRGVSLALEQGEEQRSGNGVTCMQLDDILVQSLQLFHLGDDGRHAAGTHTGRLAVELQAHPTIRLQMRMVVVDMKDGEVAGICRARTERQQHGGGDGATPQTLACHPQAGR